VTQYQFTPNEAAMLANACIALVTTDTSLSLRTLVEDRKRLIGPSGQLSIMTVSHRTVTKAIEFDIIHPRLAGEKRARRFLDDVDVLYLACFGLSEIDLAKETKILMHQQISAWVEQRKHGRTKDRPTFRVSRYLVFEPAEDDFRKWLPFIRTYAEKRDANLEIEFNASSVDAWIRGTRVTIHEIHDEIEDGVTIASLLRDWPELTEDSVVLSFLYAHVNPRSVRKGKSAS
jgi:uncharacterized protein (DUF433 family)